MTTYALFDQSEYLQIGHSSSERCPTPVMFPSDVLVSIGDMTSLGAGVTGSDLVPLSTAGAAPAFVCISVDALLVVNSDLVATFC